MALLNVGADDPWLLEYDSCEKLHRDIMEQLILRERYPKSSDRYINLSATIRLRLKQYNNEVAQLSQKLEIATTSGSITVAESERRIRQLEQMHSKGVQAQKLFDRQTFPIANENRSQLMGDDSLLTDNRPSGSHYSVDQLQSDQTRMLGEQEQGLESLSKIINRQKNIAGTIAGEIDLHHEILDDLSNRMNTTDARVRNETQHITVVTNKDKTCVYWVLIILLLVCIIAVACI